MRAADDGGALDAAQAQARARARAAEDGVEEKQEGSTASSFPPRLAAAEPPAEVVGLFASAEMHTQTEAEMEMEMETQVLTQEEEAMRNVGLSMLDDSVEAVHPPPALQFPQQEQEKEPEQEQESAPEPEQDSERAQTEPLPTQTQQEEEEAAVRAQQALPECKETPSQQHSQQQQQYEDVAPVTRIEASVVKELAEVLKADETLLDLSQVMPNADVFAANPPITHAAETGMGVGTGADAANAASVGLPGDDSIIESIADQQQYPSTAMDDATTSLQQQQHHLPTHQQEQLGEANKPTPTTATRDAGALPGRYGTVPLQDLAPVIAEDEDENVDNEDDGDDVDGSRCLPSGLMPRMPSCANWKVLRDTMDNSLSALIESGTWRVHVCVWIWLIWLVTVPFARLFYTATITAYDWALLMSSSMGLQFAALIVVRMVYTLLELALVRFQRQMWRIMSYATCVEEAATFLVWAGFSEFWLSDTKLPRTHKARWTRAQLAIVVVVLLFAARRLHQRTAHSGALLRKYASQLTEHEELRSALGRLVAGARAYRAQQVRRAKSGIASRKPTTRLTSAAVAAHGLVVDKTAAGTEPSIASGSGGVGGDDVSLHSVEDESSEPVFWSRIQSLSRGALRLPHQTGGDEIVRSVRAARALGKRVFRDLSMEAREIAPPGRGAVRGALKRRPSTGFSFFPKSKGIASSGSKGHKGSHGHGGGDNTKSTWRSYSPHARSEGNPPSPVSAQSSLAGGASESDVVRLARRPSLSSIAGLFTSKTSEAGGGEGGGLGGGGGGDSTAVSVSGVGIGGVRTAALSVAAAVENPLRRGSRRSTLMDVPAKPEMRLRHRNVPTDLVLDLATLIDQPALRQRLRALVDGRDTGQFMEDASKALFEHAYKRVVFLSSSIAQFATRQHSVERLVNIVFWFLMVLLSAFIMGVDLFNILIPVSTLILVTSFAMSALFSNLVLDFAFAAMAPFDVGDHVLISEYKTGRLICVVTDIGVLRTTFRSLHNEIIVLPNHTLFSTAIVNHRDSVHATLELIVELDMRCMPQQVKEFQEFVHEYGQQNAGWESCDTWVYDVFCRRSSISVALWCVHRSPWQDALAIYDDRSDLVLAVHAWLQKHEMIYRLPEQPVSVVHNMATGGEPQPGAPAAGVYGADGFGAQHSIHPQQQQPLHAQQQQQPSAFHAAASLAAGSLGELWNAGASSPVRGANTGGRGEGGISHAP